MEIMNNITQIFFCPQCRSSVLTQKSFDSKTIVKLETEDRKRNYERDNKLKINKNLFYLLGGM